MAAARQNVRHVVPLILIEVPRAGVEQQLGEPDDRVQRGAQLVRHVREELAFQGVGPLQLEVGLLKLLVDDLELLGALLHLALEVRVHPLDVLEMLLLLLQLVEVELVRVVDEDAERQRQHKRIDAEALQEIRHPQGQRAAREERRRRPEEVLVPDPEQVQPA